MNWTGVRRTASAVVLLSPAIAQAQCAGWLTSTFHSPGGGPSSGLFTFSTWDPDGAGPVRADLILAGGFSSVGGFDIAGIVRWNGREWLGMGASPNNGSARAIVNWDPDGAGPLDHVLVVGGEFTTFAGQPMRRVAMWDGSAWSALGNGFDGSVLSTTTWDPDGAGPEPEWLVAGALGQSTPPTGATIERFEGGDWVPIGGIDARGFLSQGLVPWDPDGPGPQPSVLVSGGEGYFDESAFRYMNIIYYDHSVGVWQPVGAGLNGKVYALHTFDFDGPGPQPPSLVAGGSFTATGDGATPLLRIARWDGTQWLPIGAGFTGGFFDAVGAMTTWDPDGDGPLAPELVAVGGFTHSGATSVQSIARWTGTAWVSFNGGLDATARGVIAWRPEGGPPELVVGGTFARTISGTYAAGWARWSDIGRPWFTIQPGDIVLPASGGTANFSAAPADGYGHLGQISVQWTRNGVPISDGPGGASPGGGTVTGATDAFFGAVPTFMSISSVTASDTGVYECRITNSCGESISRAASLTITCPVDLNGDGIVDFSDYLEFLNLFDAGDLRVDFTGDGIVDFSDYLEFLNLFEAGC